MESKLVKKNCLSISYFSLKKTIFLLIMFIYGFFSTPTPDRMGIPEIIMLVLLIIMFGNNAEKLVKDTISSVINFRKIIIFLFAFYFVFFCSFWGLTINQNTPSNFIRDFIPFIYLCIPILMHYDIKRKPNDWLSTLIIGMIIAGIGFIWQFYIDPSVKLQKILTFHQIYGSNRDYPWQDSVSIFAFSFFAGMSTYYLFKKRFINFFVFFLFYVFFLLVYAVTISRAPIVLSFVTMLIVLWFVIPYKSRNKWQKRLSIIILIILFSFPIMHLLFPVVSNIFKLVIEKTQRVGITNARITEIKAVINNITCLSKLFLGEGWGGLISNPIGGGAKWRFVHNMIFYFLFKTGFLGILLIVIYIGWILRPIKNIKFFLKKLDTSYAISFIALFPPLIVSGALEPSFKSLSFGVLLSTFLAFYYNYIAHQNIIRVWRLKKKDN